VHRAGAPGGRGRQYYDARVDEHRNLGVAFYKTGMLTKSGARVFAAVAELRAPPNATFYIDGVSSCRLA